MTMPPPHRERPAGRLFAAIAGRRAAALALFAAFVLATRAAIFGDWNHEIDVQFYMLAGRRLLDGALLYVDLWDRKPPALYLAYAALVATPAPYLAVMLAGIAATALAAYGIHRIALPWAGPQGSLLAGGAYGVLTMQFGGATAEAPVLFNPLMVAAAWALAASLAQLARGVLPGRVVGGVACAGLALAFKQSALVEGVAYGLAALALAWRGGASPARLLAMAAVLATVGALPLLLAVGWYLAIGQFPALWQALVLSSTTRTFDDLGGMIGRYAVLARLLAPIGLFAAMGVIAMRRRGPLPAAYALMLGWLAVAALALLAYPGLYLHYALSLLAPLCLVAAPFFARRDLGLPAFILLAGATLVYAGAFDFTTRAASREASARLVDYVRQETPGHRLLLWNRSPWLYALAGSAMPPSPLLFPPHLYEGAEAATSGRDTVAELRRILAWRPEAVVVQEPLPVRPLNEATVALVAAYVKQCPRVRRFTLHDHNGPQVQAVYSGCAAAPAPTQSAGPATGR